MRRLFLVLALTTFVVGGAFAQFSIGGGFVFDGGRVGGISFDEGGFSESVHMNHFGFGGFLFLDATFAELSVAFMGGPSRVHAEFSEPGYPTGRETYDGSFLAMDFSLLGKFPIALGAGNSTVFPLLGVGYNLVLSKSDEDGNDMFEYSDRHSATDLSSFRIKLGVGGDFFITDSVFLRGSVLGYYRFPGSYFRYFADEVPGLNAHGGFGGIVRLAIGFRF